MHCIIYTKGIKKRNKHFGLLYISWLSDLIENSIRAGKATMSVMYALWRAHNLTDPHVTSLLFEKNVVSSLGSINRPIAYAQKAHIE